MLGIGGSDIVSSILVTQRILKISLIHDIHHSQGWKAWRTGYGTEIDQQFRHIASSFLPNPVTFVIIWNNDSLLGHLRTTIESTTGFDNAKYVIVSETTSNIKNRISEEFACEYYEMPLKQLASGLSVEFPSHTPKSSEFTLPSESGTPILVSRNSFSWLQSQLDLIHLGVGAEPSLDESDFLRGGKITWDELSLRRDAERDITNTIARRVRGDLLARDTTKITIHHKPGSGGTTISRRVVWDLHRDFPSVVIHTGDSKGIVERIAFIVAETRLTVLALVDSADIAEREIESIYDLLKSRSISCVLLRVSRCHQLPKQSRRSFSLQIQLEPSELHRFFDKFANFVPERRDDLKSIVDTRVESEKTAFQFGLTAYGRDYRGLESYVSNRINRLTDIQKQIINFLSIAYMYGQKGIPAQAFQHLLGSSHRDVLLPKFFEEQQSVLDILILDGMEWRPIHHIVAQEILQQILTPVDADRRIWTQQLSFWGKRFIEFCGDGQITSIIMLELLSRVFIYRDTDNALGRELGDDTSQVDYRLRTFSQFIQDIPAREGRLEVLKILAETFPEEAHFWAHLGRFQAAIMQNYPASLEAVEQAIQLQPNDHVLRHMKGMSFRYQAQGLIASRADLTEVVALAEQASDCFEESRRLNPDDEHAYISEIQLLVKILNYAVRNTQESIFQYIKRYNAIPYVRDAIDKAESLLSIVRSNREGTGSSSWEQSCRADITNLYGDYQEALQIWDNLLSRQDVYHPPVRRQIVYALIDRAKTWGSMPQKNRDRCIRLLQNNLDEQPYNDRDLRLWLQAVRYSPAMPSIESLIEKVSYWKANTGALDATYYLYVLYSLRALEGLPIELDFAIRYMKESSQLSRNRRNRFKSFEWLGKDDGIGKLVHQSVLGNWDRERNFWSNTKVLERTDGIITRVSGPQAGNIEIGGLSSFFVPGGSKKDEPISKDSVNRRVDFFLGFSYSGLRAWDVQFKD